MYRFILLISLLACAHGMTRAQVKKTMGLLKNQCMPKNSVTEDQVAKIGEGFFPDDKNVMCYVTCIYKNMQVIKNDRLDEALVTKQVDILYPPDLKVATKNAVVICIHHQDKYNDVCEGVYAAVKCLYETDPPSFIFP
ncbi:unnamed protein product [Arctia plantaginis]|uniref:Uncharacterized protein n=1 Tax=Arctia plantaginis TaxID=874455 RepID=A0A8S1AI76_ARCPL|nr:unnamed protein product [Arctia plantaginis]CAB3255603.1 unnamed protein product [Arctia plantaginis]